MKKPTREEASLLGIAAGVIGIGLIFLAGVVYLIYKIIGGLYA